MPVTVTTAPNDASAGHGSYEEFLSGQSIGLLDISSPLQTNGLYLGLVRMSRLIATGPLSAFSSEGFTHTQHLARL